MTHFASTDFNPLMIKKNNRNNNAQKPHSKRNKNIVQ